jgi:hypothetical protein
MDMDRKIAVLVTVHDTAIGLTLDGSVLPGNKCLNNNYMTRKRYRFKISASNRIEIKVDFHQLPINQNESLSIILSNFIEETKYIKHHIKEASFQSNTFLGAL